LPYHAACAPLVSGVQLGAARHPAHPRLDRFHRADAARDARRARSTLITRRLHPYARLHTGHTGVRDAGGALRPYVWHMFSTPHLADRTAWSASVAVFLSGVIADLQVGKV